jgi:hypothetical protein
MSDECGFILNNLCCCDEMECYGELCQYPDISDCPIHLEPNYQNGDKEIDLDALTLECSHEELKIRYLQIELYQKELSRLRSIVETQDKMIDKIKLCIKECDPWLCNQLKESMLNDN